MRWLVACEFSGRVRRALVKCGHAVTSVDLLPAEDGANYIDTGSKLGFHYQGDIFKFLAWRGVDEFDAMIAHPDCTRLTNAGVRWLSKPPNGKTLPQMWRALFDGAEFYTRLRDVKIPKKALENPVMHCHARELIRFADRQIVQPWWFGDPYFKATGLELINLPPLMPTNKLTPPKKGTPEHKAWSAVHRATPSPERWKDRSRTYPGIAAAMAEQWGSL